MKSNSPRDDMYLGGVSVLVVDDYEPVRTVVAAMLEHCGATVTAVSSADEALEALKRERPDVLVSDLAMPDKGRPRSASSSINTQAWTQSAHGGMIPHTSRCGRSVRSAPSTLPSRSRAYRNSA
jgi:hypothetical protein